MPTFFLYHSLFAIPLDRESRLRLRLPVHRDPPFAVVRRDVFVNFRILLVVGDLRLNARLCGRGRLAGLRGCSIDRRRWYTVWRQTTLNELVLIHRQIATL